MMILYIPDENVTIRQARKALHIMGYLNQIEQYMNDAAPEIKIEWEYSTSVKKNHPLVKQMQSLLNLTNQDIDSLFLLAATL